MDKIDKLNKDLQKLKENFDLWKNSGLNEEILIIYIADKTGYPKKYVKQMLGNMDEFFETLITKEFSEKL